MDKATASDAPPVGTMVGEADKFWSRMFQGNDVVAIGLNSSSGGWRQEQYFANGVLGDGIRDAAQSNDVYFTPVPQADEDDEDLNPNGIIRAQSIAQPGRAAYADCDHGLTDEQRDRAKELGATLVRSGSITPDGRPKYHVYVWLEEATDPRVIRFLNIELMGRLNGDSKFDTAAVLRVPGTLNHKTNPPRPVTIEHLGDMEGWNPRDLAIELGTKLPSDAELDEFSRGEAASREKVTEFLASATQSSVTGAAKGFVSKFRSLVAEGRSRHGALTEVLCWAMREAQEGRCSADEATQAIQEAFTASIAGERSRNAGSEFRAALAWAVGQLGDIDSIESERRRRIAAMRAKLLTTKQMRKLPDPEWLISNWLTLDTLARMNGKPGSYKSFIALDMGAHIATGQPWHGQEVKQGKVIYLVAEGTRGVSKRVEAWEQEFGEAEDLLIFPEPVQVMGDEWSFFAELCIQEKPSLIILDTQSRITLGIEENANSAMGEVVERLENLRRATGACVLLVHHTGHNGEHGRGASAVLGAINTEFLVSRNKNDPNKTVTLANEKEKDEEDGRIIAFQPTIVDLGLMESGDPKTSLVMRSTEVAPAASRAEVEISKSNRIQAHILDFFGKNNEFCTYTSVRAAVRKSAKIGPETFKAEFEELARAGAIVQTGGKPRSPWALNPDRPTKLRVRLSGTDSPSESDESI
ncbi:AAA family ATPase [Streptomyces anulatus]